MANDELRNTLVDSATLAHRYGVTAETVRAWFRRGWIPAYRAGRKPLLFCPSEVDQALRVRASAHVAVEGTWKEGDGR